MPTIHVEMLRGRTVEQKRGLAKAMTECFVANCGGTPSSVQIVFSEVDKDNWAFGGELFCDRKPTV